MKYLKKALLSSLFALICFNVSSQSKTMFSVEGNVKGLNKGTRLFMLIKKGDRIDTIGRSVTQNGLFKFQNLRLPVYPDFYFICIQTEFVDNLKLFLDQAGDVKITGDLKNWPNVTVTGSKTHDDYLKAEIIRKKVMNRDFVSRYPTSMAPADTILFYTSKGIDAVIEQMPNSYYVPAMIATWTYTIEKYTAPVEMREPLYKMLSPKLKESNYGKILGLQIANWHQNQKRMLQLEESAIELKSISRDEVAKQLMEATNKLIAITPLPISGKQLTKAELEAKSKAATLIVNMGYHNAGDSVIRSNPTSAYVIDERGICVTNYHVGKEYSSKEPYRCLSVMTFAGKVYTVTKILSCSESDDLMVFQVDTKGDQLSAFPLGNAAATGANIHVMAHPMLNFYRFTTGLIVGYSTSTLDGKDCAIMNITADFNVGSSGGPIVDDYGNVVGTVSRIDGGMKVGIPVSELKKLLEFKK